MTDVRAIDTAPVLIAGGGPVGLTLALALAAHGVETVVVDDDLGVATEGSRAICFQQHTLAVFDRLGAAAVTDEGVSWNVGRTYYRDRELFSVRLDHGAGRFPGFVNISQARVEQLLAALAEDAAPVAVHWRHRVTGLDQDDIHDEHGGVRMHTEGPDGPRTFRGRYLCGADGGRSVVRHALEVAFGGSSHVDRFLIADIRADLPFPSERRFFFDPPFNRGRQVLVHPQPDRVWRVDWQVPADVDLDNERTSGALDARIRQVIGDVDYELVWASSYVFHQRVAERFRQGRVFLAGDAAHVMTPFGARGLNSGVADADNLAWKLALVLGGLAPDRLLDSYHAERHPAAVENLRITGDTMRFMAPPSRLARWRRNAVLRGSVLPGVGPRLRRRVNSGRLSVPATYPDSPLTGPGGGTLAADLPCRLPDGSSGHLLSLVGPRFVAVGRGIDHHVWTSTVSAAVSPAAGDPPVLAVTADGDGPNLLVRPDGYVAAEVPPGGLRDTLTTAVARHRDERPDEG